MKILLTGATGQLGRAFLALAAHYPGHDVFPQERSAWDLCDSAEVLYARIALISPDVIVNAAAYTAVDRAESDRENAFAINANAVKSLAHCAHLLGCRLIHISTDFVFDGQRAVPYLPQDVPAPLGVYGESKALGEKYLLSMLPGLVIRTAWLYDAKGQNFVNTLLRLMRSRDTLGVVADQIGTPTWSYSLAHAVWHAVERPDVTGILHWTDAGVASWYDFAVAIYEEARALFSLPATLVIRPLRTWEYPTPAKRPAFSVLDKTESWARLELSPTHWRVHLRQMLAMMSPESP